jgi:hypothetical protein
VACLTESLKRPGLRVERLFLTSPHKSSLFKGFCPSGIIIKNFTRWMASTELTDQILCQAVAEMEKGLIDADLGGGLVKKRVALPGRGKSGSARTLLATNKKDRWFFIFGFEKNSMDNIGPKTLKAFKKFAAITLRVKDKEFDFYIKLNDMEEICHDAKN